MAEPTPQHLYSSAADTPTQRVVIFSAPSGAGKTTILHAALERLAYLTFSVSATTRPRRPHELHARDYYFLDQEQFRAHIAAGDFLEWEEVYPGRFYGTLRTEMRRIAEAGQCAVYEVDVQGGLNLKRIFGNDALALFIEPPSVDVLRTRLRARNTESQEEIEKRVNKAEYELSFADEFDLCIRNESLDDAIDAVVQCIDHFVRHDSLPQPLPSFARIPVKP